MSIDHSEPGPSRMPSHSTLTTPSSSQTRVAEGQKPRSRKTSDNVDLMDVTDPWGTSWHHTSPYDIGLPATSDAHHDVRHLTLSSLLISLNYLCRSAAHAGQV
jgi:hypothetical protein